MINGNIKAVIQANNPVKNDVGESVANWEDIKTIYGYLDLQNGDVEYSKYNIKFQNSTHIFLCDYFDFDSKNTRLLIGGKIYNIIYSDNVMELGEQLEIYLKYMGVDV